jgi:hypothetical protein
MGRRRITGVAAVAVALIPAGVALGHVERTSYWPDPRPDTAVRPAAGGDVPAARSLPSALRRTRRGEDTRVVCKPDSMRRVRSAVKRATTTGYRLRPSQPVVRMSAARGRSLVRLNQRLQQRCRFSDLQPAVTASGNNDRVVVMPGVYTEPRSRAVPSLPAECDKYRTTSENGSGAVSYRYQAMCPNAVNLVALIGRAVPEGDPPPVTPTGRPDPHGIPDLGRCVRCNVQIEGSGVSADDVVLDAGRVASGNGGPIGAEKDVGLRIDRADGAVIRNMTFRHAAEHAVYVHEVDGYRLDRVKFFYSGQYGALMFTSDNGVTSNCDGAGFGDSVVYPGASPDSGTQRREATYPAHRLNQTVTRCDMRHSNLGYSGTMGNATRVVDNDIYDNTTGIATDSFFAGGHPGYPQDSAVFENNRIHDNNFNIYAEDSDVESSVPVPIGVGILIAGGNANIVRGNHIYGNWRRGTMLIAVPDVISCAPSDQTGSPPCLPQGPATVSNDNLYRDNVMGRTPEGEAQPNGVDFWWDEYATNRGNCWYPNTGSDGSRTSVTSDPPPPPVEGTSVPGFLPHDCDAPTNVGAGDPVKEAMLAGCVLAFQTGDTSGQTCEWQQMPGEPGTPSQAAQLDAAQRVGQLLAGRSDLRLSRLCQLLGDRASGTLTCAPFQGRLGDR